MLHVVSEHLLPKIGATIYCNIGIIPTDEYRSAQTLVFRIGAFAYRVVACYYRDSLRSACTEESNLHFSGKR